MAAIDIGPGAIDRDTDATADNITYIDFNNPANDTGTLDTFEVWSYVNLANTKMGTFSGSGNTFDDRDYETIGTVTAGAKRTFQGLDCDVVTGDIIGVYATTGSYELDVSGFSGVGYDTGDNFGSGVHAYLEAGSTSALSLYGIGATPVLTIIPGAIAAGSAIYAPRLNLTLPMSHIASTSLLYEPVVEMELKFIYPGFIASGAVVHAPTVKLLQTIIMESIASGAAVYPLYVRVARVGRSYRIEIRDASDNLIAILENAYGIEYVRSLNEVPSLNFSIPADDTKAAEIIRANQIWLRELHSNTVVERFRLLTTEDKRS